MEKNFAKRKKKIRSTMLALTGGNEVRHSHYTLKIS